MTDDSKKSSTKPSLKGPSKVMRYPDASHPIYSNPTVFGSRANLMRSKAVEGSEETEPSPSTPSSSPSVEPESNEKEDSSRGEPGSGGAA